MADVADGRARPILGQNHHFNRYAPDNIPYAIDRYVKETNRLYGLLDRQPEVREFITGSYSIADMASYPRIVPHEMQGQRLEDFPSLGCWFEAIAARPATVRAYAKGAELQQPQTAITDEQRRVLFGQTAGPR